VNLLAIHEQLFQLGERLAAARVGQGEVSGSSELPDSGALDDDGPTDAESKRMKDRAKDSDNRHQRERQADAPRLPTEISWNEFCDRYIAAHEEDERRLARLPARFRPGEGVFIPITPVDSRDCDDR
jgi:hypothetical protein